MDLDTPLPVILGQMAKPNSWSLVIESLRAAGLDQKDENGRNVYHPHTLRTYALNHMRSEGLNETMAKQIVGHDTGVEEHYKDWEQIAKSWQEKCEQEFTFLTDTRVLEKVKVETEMAKAQSDRLKERFAELREAVQIYRDKGKEALDWLIEKKKQQNPKPVDLLTESPIGRLIEAEENIIQRSRELSLISGKTQKFSNHVYDYIKTSIKTREFDQALIEGYEKYLEDPKTGLIVLRKPKRENSEVLVRG
jgi:hypothetical protein